MQIYFWKCQRFIKNIAIFIMAIGFGVIFAVCTCQRFSTLSGESVYYLSSASSQGVRKQSLCLSDIFQVKGESVRVGMGGKSGDEFAERIMKAYRTKLVCTEKVAGVVSYYAYTTEWSDGVFLNGVKVNLHIAYLENSNTCVVGSPIIFDGY